MIPLLFLSFLPNFVDAEDPVAAGQELFNRVERDLGRALGKFESHEALPEKSPWWDVIGVKETKISNDEAMKICSGPSRWSWLEKAGDLRAEAKAIQKAIREPISIKTKCDANETPPGQESLGKAEDLIVTSREEYDEMISDSQAKQEDLACAARSGEAVH